MHSKILIISLLALAMGLTACAPAGAAAPATNASASPLPTAPLEANPTRVITQTPPMTGTDTLKGTSWSLVTLEGRPVLTGTTVTLNFEDGQLGGKDGCNSYGAPYISDGSHLKLTGDIVSTMRACEETIMEQSAAYNAALTTAATYQLTEQQLTLLNAEGQATATFQKQSVELGDTSWNVVSYHTDQEAATRAIAGSQLTANFGADGRITGSAGCNNFNGSYELTGQTLKIKAIVATLKACLEPAGIMEQEQQYLKALEAVATYQFDGDRLELRSADDGVLVTLEKAL